MKANELQSRCPDIRWHFIGQLQSNKVGIYHFYAFISFPNNSLLFCFLIERIFHFAICNIFLFIRLILSELEGFFLLKVRTITNCFGC